VERDAAHLRNALRKSRGAGHEPAAVVAVPEVRGHDVTTDLAGIAVGDDALQVVPDLGSDSSIVDGEDDQQTVIASLLSDTLSVVFEHPVGVALEVCIWLEGLDRGDDEHVAAGSQQLAAQAVELSFLRRAD